MKRKLRIDRLIILIVAAIVMIALLVFAFKGIISLFDKPDNPQNTNDPIVDTIDKVESFEIDLVDYEVYKLDDIDFNFVLARFRIKDVNSIKYSLSSLYTSEKTVKLSDYQKYISELEMHEYYIGAQNVNFDITSNENSDIFKIFIPINDKNRNSLEVYDAISKAEFKFDLTKNVKNGNDLQYHTGQDELITTEEYEIVVNNAYIGNSFYQNNEEYTYPSTIQIYVFVLDVKTLTNKDLVLEDAIFIPNGSDEEYHALDASITSSKINNLISRNIREGERGGLFFEMYNPNESGIKYNGTLKLKFSNSDNWLSIKTELQ